MKKEQTRVLKRWGQEGCACPDGVTPTAQQPRTSACMSSSMAEGLAGLGWFVPASWLRLCPPEAAVARFLHT